MKIRRSDIVTMSIIAAIVVYLFVEAPMAIPDGKQVKGEEIPVEVMFKIVAEENNRARKLWTGEIVGSKKVSGLKFDEDWREEHIEAGPLPALFLREVAKRLEKSPVKLSLFLGSDFPISTANKFEGTQAEAFKKLRTGGEPQYFYASDIKRHTAMFADYGNVQPCISCHNDHKDSPKTDWELDDIMGATTWAYPDEVLSRDELVEIIATLRNAFAQTYISYLDKTQSFVNAPEIGKHWPKEGGYTLPTASLFMERFSNDASHNTVRLLLAKLGDKQ